MKIKKFNEVIDNKEILNKFDSSNKDYVSFRKNYTSEIKSIIDDNDGRFVMTHVGIEIDEEALNPFM